MRSIAELRHTARLAAEGAQTDTSTSNITNVQPQIWKTEVIKFAEKLRYFDQLVYVNKELVGNKNVTLNLPYTSSALNMDTSPSEGEGGTRDWTEMTNINRVQFAIAAGDWLRGGISVTKHIFNTCCVDLLSQAKYSIAQDMAQDVDDAVCTALQSTSITTNLAWGGDATQVEDLADGDVLTTDLIADAIRLIETNDFVPKYLVITPYQKATLLKDSQFVNASEYGGREVIMKGEIGSYLGLKIIVSNNSNLAYTTGDTETNEAASPGADMNENILIAEKRNGEKCSVGLAWKEMPHIDYEYEKNEARHLIYYDQCFTTNMIFTEAIALIKVTQT